ncbi:MAG: 3D domain-containing protein [Pontiellaceae bacterium]|nr:hypothetical protein [Kiritimatiellaceae bacterium]HBO87663.1 hypothetical protein [Verrucomicrobiota bacterium]|tara:strand:- start:164 stop:610 length:447 start_codon:yes stop_codon:yes gene_type:complete
MKKNLFLFLTLLFISGCATTRRYAVPIDQSPERMTLTLTGYCECGICCGWKRNWRFQPVYAYGPNKGKPKEVGITSSGTRAVRGTIAADTRLFPYGTIIQVPGYGWGRVEDIGGAIKGHHIDLFFDSHQEAIEWGRQKKQVLIWKPRR